VLILLLTPEMSFWPIFVRLDITRIRLCDHTSQSRCERKLEMKTLGNLTSIMCLRYISLATLHKLFYGMRHDETILGMKGGRDKGE
jgi:hypothetical protein